MAMFNFGKKKAPATSNAGAPGSPIDQITMMQQQGMDNTTIINELQKQGYNSTQIYDAMNQAQIQGPGAMPPGSMIDSGAQGYDPNMMEPAPEMMPPGPEMMPPPSSGMAEAPQSESNRELIEEIAEAIIDEKWKEFEDDLRKIIEWKDQTESKIGALTQQIQDLTNSVNSLHKNILNKIGEYDRNIVDVGTEIKAMEKVFQKVLPSLTENVNKLERMADDKPSKK